jgi:glycosyltransferase involved in cell wall biosynthesis
VNGVVHRRQRTSAGSDHDPSRDRQPSPACLRVCHLIHSLGSGGAEHVLVDLAKVSRRAGMDVSVVSMMRAEGARHAEELRALEVPVRSLGLASRWDPRALRRGVAVTDELQPDIVHTHLKHADLVGAHVASRLGVPLVSTLHLIEDGPTPVGRMKRRLAATVRRRHAALTIAVSDALRQWYIAEFGVPASSVLTVRNGVSAAATISAAQRTALRSELGVRADALLAVFVGLMRPGKGHDALLDAVERTPEDINVRYVLAGDGPLRAVLAARVRRSSRLARSVVFAGFREDVGALLQAADLLIHPSRFDALPTAVIHGLAAGLPIVASNVGGIPEIVTPDVGLLVRPEDDRSLAKAITTMARDSGMRARMGAAARRRFDQEFAAEAWAARLHTQYQTVLARR